MSTEKDALIPPRYVPILKLKMGEVEAIKQLGRNPGYTPLIEIMPLGADHEDDESGEPLDTHVQKHWNRFLSLAESFRPIPMFDLEALPIWLDTSYLDRFALSSGEPALAYFGGEWANTDLHVVPVIDFFATRSIVTVCAELAHRDGRGVVIRLDRDAFSSRDVTNEIRVLLANLRLAPDQIDIVFDLSGILSTDVNMVIGSQPTFTNRFPHLNEWRSFTLAGTGFPPTVSSIPSGYGQLFPRHEWDAWCTLRSGGDLHRVPDFGDYAIAHPEISQNSGGGKSVPQVRYTLERDWIVYRGSKASPANICRTFCQELIANGHHRGASYSLADQDIYNCTLGNFGPGNATTWRRVGTGQHIPFVISQLAALGTIPV